MTDKPIDRSTEESQQGAQQRRAQGEFVRGLSKFRNQLGSADFPAEPGRYHLFVALNCPWCHRVTLARNILGLQESVSLNVAFPSRTGEEDPAGPNLWEFNPGRVSALTGAALPECTAETATGMNYRLTSEIYAAEGSEERSVPILYDKRSRRIVNNESADIVRLLNEHAGPLGSGLPSADRPDLCPSALRDQVTTLNALIYTNINNGAYKAGFSSNQTVYETAYRAYFATLEKLNAQLADGRRFLAGDRLTETDLRLFPTLYRHDPVYYLRMKLNGAKILDYPHLWRWLCRVYALDGVPASSSLIHCRQGYFGRSWNNVVPLGPLYPMTYPQAYEHAELARSVGA